MMRRMLTVGTVAALLLVLPACAGLGVKVCVDPPDQAVALISGDEAKDKVLCVQGGAGFDTPKPVAVKDLEKEQ